MPIFRPTLYQGKYKRGNYFEGWYFKHAMLNRPGAFSVIPGISKGEDGHAFVQVIDGEEHRSWYQRYPLESFKAARNPFELEVGPNHFSLSKMQLNLKELGIEGTLFYEGITKFPWKPWSPGIMGPYTFVPFMECYHGVVSMNHRVCGTVSTPTVMRSFHDGTGYIEKDWGKAFPKSWIWLQGNQFDQPHTSLMLSVANIPWLRSSFTGFLAFVLFKGRNYLFTSYNGSAIEHFRNQGGSVWIKIKRYGLTLEISLKQHNTGELAAPAKGTMERVIKESVDSQISFVLKKRGVVIVQGVSSHCGSEICGQLYI